MVNKFGIPEKELIKIRERDKDCVYCHKKMSYPFVSTKQRDYATIEHLNLDGPFYWKDKLQIDDVVICCGQCNSSRGIKKLSNWFKTKYCRDRNINENTVAEPVKKIHKLSSYKSIKARHRVILSVVSLHCSPCRLTT